MEDVTHIGVLSNTVVKDDGIVWYEPVVATEDSPTWSARGCVFVCSSEGVIWPARGDGGDVLLELNSCTDLYTVDLYAY